MVGKLLLRVWLFRKRSLLARHALLILFLLIAAKRGT